MPLIANLFQLESSIQKHVGSKGAVVGGEAPLKKKILIFFSKQKKILFSLKLSEMCSIFFLICDEKKKLYNFFFLD